MSIQAHQVLRAGLSCVLLVITSASASAQAPTSTPRNEQQTVTNPGAIVPFLEGTDVFFSLKEDTIFEADIMPHLIAYQNFDDVLNIDAQRARGGKVKQFAVAVSGTPGVRIRMFESVSSPVRTPSYMPRGDFQFLWARNVAPFVQELTGRPTNNQVSIWEGHVVVGHHSNGQDGCFWQDEERVDEVCVSVTPIVGDRQVNKHDGSFST